MKITANKPKREGFYWYQKLGCEPTVVQIERRPDSGELYAFSIGFEGGISVGNMDGNWSEALPVPFV